MDEAYVLKYNDETGYVRLTQRGRADKVNLFQATLFPTYEMADDARDSTETSEELWTEVHIRRVVVG